MLNSQHQIPPQPADSLPGQPCPRAKFVADVRTVLGALATQPAQVAAGAAGSLTRGAAQLPGTGKNSGGMEVDGGARAAGNGRGGVSESTVGYLSSPQLFGLQLRDATFRRDLLVQVRGRGGGRGGRQQRG